MSEHTTQCLAAREKERAELAAYESQWPNYCRKCGGCGIVFTIENAAPHGSGETWLMDASDYCEHCIGQGKCPRCGALNENTFAADEYPLHCASCGWTEGDTGAPEVLNPHDCGCGEPTKE